MTPRRAPRRRVVYVKQTLDLKKGGPPVEVSTGLECGHVLPVFARAKYRACPECREEGKK